MTSEKQKAKTYCFCVDKIFKIGFSNARGYKLIDGKTQPCKSVTDNYLKYNAFTIGITILIPILDAIMIMVLTKITIFERNKTLTKEMRSVMAKVFLSSFINTVKIIIII